MSWLAVLEVVFPVFAVAGLGYAIAGRRSVDLELLTDLVVYVGAPCLIFASLTGRAIDYGAMTLLLFGSLWVVCTVGLAVRAASALFGIEVGSLYLPAMFMNAGNMLLPLCLFAFGDEGMRYGVMIFVTITVLQSSLGVTIASGKLSIGEILRFPHIYAVVAAIAVDLGGLAVPTWLGRPVALLGDMTIPLMLIALGVRLRSLDASGLTGPMAAAVVRIAGGYAAGLSFVTIFGVTGTPRDCLLLASVMPSAVVTFVFAEKYGRGSGAVAAAIAASTLLSVITTPLLLAFGL